jgi:hypothetical protein
MTYEILAIVVAINAAITLSLWRKVSNRGRFKLNKKAAAALWRSDPIIPKHDPPKIVGGEFSSLELDYHRQFFADFREFADVLNRWFADTASRFRMQDLPDRTRTLDVDHSHGPMFGRSFEIYYNQSSVGRLEISPRHGYTTALPEVYTSLEIDWARFFGFRDLMEFLDAIASHVTENSDYINAGRSIQSALTSTLWDNYRISQYDSRNDEEQQSGELTVRFSGTAFFYIDRRDAPVRPRTR